jgi:uncharacterized protein (TIGR03083 family)
VVETRYLFAPLHAELMSLLRGLAPSDWERQTVARAWRVRDVAAHLLDTQLRRLSAHRDGHQLRPDRQLVDYLNHLNATWVAAAQRLSPRAIVDLLAVSGPAVVAFFESLPPEARAFYPVSWAGEEESQNWMDVGREYTEWWHHQMQIRDAVGAPLLLERMWLAPLLDLSVLAIRPSAPLLFVVDDYRFALGPTGPPAVTVSTDADTAWRMLYNALAPEEIAARVRIDGDREAARAVTGARSVMV